MSVADRTVGADETKDSHLRTVNDLDAIVLRTMLERRAESDPDESFLTFADGRSWTRRDALTAAYRAANVMRDAGVRQGDRVSIFLTNGPGYLKAWWGAVTLGAVIVPLNTGYKGVLLAHQVNQTQPVAMITDADLGARLDPDLIEVDYLTLDVAALDGGEDTPPPLERPLFYGDNELLVLTSGTTGPSKLVATSYLHNYLGGEHYVVQKGRGAEDVLLIDLPLYHSAAVYIITAALSNGAKIVVREYPAMTTYWEVARDTGATMVVQVSSMMSFLESQAPRAAEKEHNIRAVLVAPLPNDPKRFMERFAIPEMYTVYGSTETSGALVSELGDALTPGYCGRVRDGFDVAVVDANDVPVPTGESGELVVRTDLPWAVMSEYEGNPEATAKAWRNGWFHTGDMMRSDEDGRYFFVDRIKDALRRRGENISSFEVEQQVQSHPSVAEVACVPFRAEGQIEDEIKVWVVVAEGETFDADALFHHSFEHLPYFMVPRYFEAIDSFPRTPNMKVRKVELRDSGNSSATWDAEAAGYRWGRKGLEVLLQVDELA